MFPYFWRGSGELPQAYPSQHSLLSSIYSCIFMPFPPFRSLRPNNIMQSLSSFFSSDRVSLRTQAFAERFKYGVISSSLLSPAFATTPLVESHRRGLSTSLPGKLHSGHSRTPSAAESMVTDTLSLSIPPDPEAPIWPLTLSFTIVTAAFSAQFYFFAFLLLAGTLYYIHVHRVDIHSKPDVMTPVSHFLPHIVHRLAKKNSSLYWPCNT